MCIHFVHYKQMCVYILSDRSKTTCLIHVHGHSSEQFKLINKFVTRYDAIKPFKDGMHDTTTNIKNEESGS